jgi:hypothetical protein
MECRASISLKDLYFRSYHFQWSSESVDQAIELARIMQMISHKHMGDRTSVQLFLAKVIDKVFFIS